MRLAICCRSIYRDGNFVGHRAGCPDVEMEYGTKWGAHVGEIDDPETVEKGSATWGAHVGEIDDPETVEKGSAT